MWAYEKAAAAPGDHYPGIKGLKNRTDWIEDCLNWHGRVLIGDEAHWCWEWDFLPVDESTPAELDCCHCDFFVEDEAA